jgi:DNA-binding transcriptional MerR regulator
MVRKRYPWTRARDRSRIRSKRPAPKTGWLIAELAVLSGQQPRTIRYYVEQGLLARPAFHGTATRYQRLHLLRLLAIERLKRDGLTSLVAIKQRLDATGEAELLAAVSARPPSAAVAAALELPAAGTHAAALGAERTVSMLHAAPASGVSDPGPPWRRLLLLPGLELLLADDASPAVHNVAAQIRAYCARH